MNLHKLQNWLDQLEDPRIFWWRDDDTGSDSDGLQRLITLQNSIARPLVVSAVPRWLNRDCRDLLAKEPGIFIAQHGFDHSDHASPGEKSVELGGNAAPQRIIERLQQGRQCLKKHDLPNLLALLVPPWNRLSEPVLEALPGLGFMSLSTFARDQRGLPLGLNHINCHIDPILWRKGKRHMSETELAEATMKHLSEGAGRPTGLLTHHLDMADADYPLLQDYLSLLAGHRKIIWPSPIKLFGQFA